MEESVTSKILVFPRQLLCFFMFVVFFVCFVGGLKECVTSMYISFPQTMFVFFFSFCVFFVGLRKVSHPRMILVSPDNFRGLGVRLF